MECFPHLMGRYQALETLDVTFGPGRKWVNPASFVNCLTLLTQPPHWDRPGPMLFRRQHRSAPRARVCNGQRTRRTGRMATPPTTAQIPANAYSTPELPPPIVRRAGASAGAMEYGRAPAMLNTPRSLAA